MVRFCRMVMMPPAHPRGIPCFLLSIRDAWAKHKDLDSYEAKWLYVDALLKVTYISSIFYVS